MKNVTISANPFVKNYIFLQLYGCFPTHLGLQVLLHIDNLSN